jgi:hypothetical protein
MGFQVQSLQTHRVKYYKKIDEWALQNALKLINKASDCSVSADLLKQISSIYMGAKVESIVEPSRKFSVAYHTPITGDLEFLIARTLYRYSLEKELGWEVHLRKPKKMNNRMLVPDVRIDKGGKTIGIIEIKARVGWMQPFFSEEQLQKGILRKERNPRAKDPQEIIQAARDQLEKYIKGFGLAESKRETMFMLVPSLAAAHRKKNTSSMSMDEIYLEYKKTFSDHSGLDQQNLVVLTKDLGYDAGMTHKNTEKPILADPKMVTDEFREMVKLISRNGRNLKN